jgi:hypothetical protein
LRANGRDVALLDDFAVTHDRDARAEKADHRQVVAHEDHRQIAFAMKPSQQVENLGLHGHIERGRRLIAQQHARFDNQCPCDRDTLPLAP